MATYSENDEWETPKKRPNKGHNKNHLNPPATNVLRRNYEDEEESTRYVRNNYGRNNGRNNYAKNNGRNNGNKNYGRNNRSFKGMVWQNVL